MKDNGKVLAAALAGLAIGAIMGLLFAPDKGSQIRSRWAGSLKRSPLNDPSEEIYHDEHHDQPQNQKLKRPAVEKLKATKEKLTAAAPHIANGISGN